MFDIHYGFTVVLSLGPHCWVYFVNHTVFESHNRDEFRVWEINLSGSIIYVKDQAIKT